MLWHQVSIFLGKVSLLKITRELSPQVTAIAKYCTSYDSAFPLLISFSVTMFTRSSHKGQIIFHTSKEYSLPDPIAMLSHESTRSHRFVKELIHIYLHTYLSPYNLFLELHQYACLLLPWRLSFLLNFFQVSLSLQCILASLLLPGILKYLWSLKSQKLGDFYNV